MPGHTPVLFSEVLQFLQLQPNDTVIDATLGAGGHARGMLEAIAPNGRLLGLEADPRTLSLTTVTLHQAFGQRAVIVAANFRQLKIVAEAHGFTNVAGVLFDLGLSSMTVEDAARGFSFQHDGPLDMRFDPAQALTAAAIVNTWSTSDLASLFRESGEERMADQIARHLVDQRQPQPFSSTLQLAEAIAQVKHRRGRSHPATQVFQALRMAVNDELGALTEALPQALSLLTPGGRLAVITFHSIEDRLVKRWMKEQAQHGRLELLTKHVIVPGRPEQLSNPRSRSAKLRVAQRSQT